MLNGIVGAMFVSGILLIGWGPSGQDVPAPVPQPGPGPTVPPKPGEPVPSPPPAPLPLLPPELTNQSRSLPYLFAEAAAEEYETVSGILGKVDLVQNKGLITTDLGREVTFEIVKPELFLNLSPGQRVTLKLDTRQRAIRVMESTAPELPPPSTPR